MQKNLFELETTFHVCLGNKWEETFGIVFKNGTQLTLSNNFFVKFDRNYDKAFAYIKNEIINLLDAIDKDNYAAVESCDIPSYFKYMLLIIYFPEKVLPVCQESLLYRYCEKLYITNDSNKEMIYINNMLINWKNDVPEIADWSNEIFTSFCDWLYRKNLTIDGNMLRKDARINMSRITEEIDGLNLQGKTKEAVVKVRVNQRIF